MAGDAGRARPAGRGDSPAGSPRGAARRARRRLRRHRHRPVRLGDVQPQGKRRMPAADWARGLHSEAADTPGSADHGRLPTCPPRPRTAGRRPAHPAVPAGPPRRYAAPHRLRRAGGRDEREAYANLLLPRLLAERSITGRDAALATELTYGTLRGLGTYDAVLAACSDRPLDKLDPPPSWTCSGSAPTSCSPPGSARTPRSPPRWTWSRRWPARACPATSTPSCAGSPPGISTSGSRSSRPARESDPDGYLAVRYSYPRWIVRAYRDALGDAAEAELAAALAAGNERPRVTMAAFPGGPGPGRGAARRRGAVPLVAVRLHAAWRRPVRPDRRRKGRRAGRGEPARRDRPRQRSRRRRATATAAADAAAWLDMCALVPAARPGCSTAWPRSRPARPPGRSRHPPAPGGAGGGRASPLRRGRRPGRRRPAGRLRGGRGGQPAPAMARRRRSTGCSRTCRARVLARSAAVPKPGGASPSPTCPLSPELQRGLLRSAIAAGRPGGVVAYVTCSPVPAETSDVVTDVVRSDPDVEVLDAPAVLSDVPAVRSASPRFAQLWPHRHGTDAIFVALLRRGTQ